jgi:succinylarginine dihydrolase
MFVQQSPEVIDAGVFHNDVIAVGTDNVLLMHEDAFLNGDQVIQELHTRLGGTFTPLIVRKNELSVQEAVRTYLFNSQLLATPEGMIIVAPSDAAEHPASKAVLDRLVSEETPIKAVHALDVRESMHNGGGPACLRLRVGLRPDELTAVHAGVMLTDTLAANLETWIDRFYPDTLSPADLADPDLLVGTRDALQALTDLLQLGPVYPFQQ